MSPNALPSTAVQGCECRSCDAVRRTTLSKSFNMLLPTPCTGQVLRRPAPEGEQAAAPSKGRYHIHTMGCQMNLADSERMAGALEVRYLEMTDNGHHASFPHLRAPFQRCDLTV